ncbi:MAG: hypothetical protein ABIJ03_01965, partial [Patescibacteria group bacterium]|nr:hypothetical protein [Patescibacteria group bacterium]
MTNKRFWLLALGAILLGIVFRFWLLGQVPASLYWDEQAIELDAWSVAVTGLDWHSQPWWQ